MALEVPAAVEEVALAELFFKFRQFFLQPSPVGGRSKADRLGRGEVALAIVVGLIRVLGERPEQGGALGLGGNHDLQHLHRRGRLIEPFFVEHPHHFLGQFGIGLWGIQSEIARPGLRHVGEQFFALARQFVVADGVFPACFVKLSVDEAFPRAQVLGLHGDELLVLLHLSGEARLGGAAFPGERVQDSTTATSHADAKTDEAHEEQQGEADVDHLDRAATAASSEVEEHLGDDSTDSGLPGGSGSRSGPPREPRP